MKNRNMPAKPNDIDIPTMRHMGMSSDKIYDVGIFNSGLTKLEYAAIQIFSGACADPEFGDENSVRFAINRAHALFDELEQEQSE